MMSQEIERLNQTLRGKMDELNSYELKSRSWQQDGDDARRKVNEY